MKNLHPKKSKPESTAKNPLARIVLFILVAASLYGVFSIIEPFIPPIILALFLVTIFHPFYRKLRQSTNYRENLSAALTVAVVFIVVVIPLGLMATAIIRQGMNFFQQVQEWVQQGKLEQLLEGNALEEIMQHPGVQEIRTFMVDRFFQGDTEKFDLAQRLLDLSKNIIQFLGSRIVPIMTKTGFIVLNFFIMLFIMFYAFRDGEKMLSYLWSTLPLSGTHKRMLVERIRFVSRAVLMGILLTAAVQAMIAMIGFKIVGVPALFWGVMLGIASLVPIVGTTLVWIPATIYLFLAGKIGAAIFLFLWCSLLVASVDNFLRPFLMQGKSGMSTIILFFALLGGIRLFGPIGILYGPLIFGLCAVMLYIYRTENRKTLAQLQNR